MMLRIVRFIFPFLFVRNWHDGHWEVSYARLGVFVAGIIFIILGIILMYSMQAPAVYVAPTV